MSLFLFYLALVLEVLAYPFIFKLSKGRRILISSILLMPYILWNLRVWLRRHPGSSKSQVKSKVKELLLINES